MPLIRLSLAIALVTASATLTLAKPVTLTVETNLRHAPGTKSEVITLLPKGSEVEVGECDAGWCKVTFNGKEGFAIERNLGTTPPPTAGVRQPQQADLQKLRHGYEQYFDADGPASQQQRYTARRGQPYYDEDDDVDVAYAEPPAYYVAPGPYYYAPRYYYPGPYYYGPAGRPYGYWRRW
jgi:hypothetical protein